MVFLGVTLFSYGGAASASAVPAADPATGPVGPLRAPGGPDLVDHDGRVVLLHGVDLVYKIPPYEVEVTGSGRNVLTPAEAQRMAYLGFDVVRLGIIWKGLEPGHDPINDPPICTPGKPSLSAADQFNAKVFDAYVDRLEATVSLLGHYGIYSLHRHAPGRLQRGVRRGGGAGLGRLHRRDHPQAAAQRPELECELHRTRAFPRRTGTSGTTTSSETFRALSTQCGRGSPRAFATIRGWSATTRSTSRTVPG